MMNREQRRAYASKIKGDKRASKCPLCGYTSLFYSAPVLKPYEGVKEKFVAEDFDVVIKCDVCGGTVLANDAITKLIKPGVYLPLPLDIFEMALKYENDHPEEENKEQLYKENGYADRTFNLNLE